jgi:hypothetical protein
MDIEHGYLIGAAREATPSFWASAREAKEAVNVQVEEIMIPKDELIVMRSNALAGWRLETNNQRK